MSGNSEEDKTDANKTSLPLDLASKITVTKTIDLPKGTPLVMSQSLRGMRVLTQSAVTGAVSGASTGSSIIVPQTIIKQAINPSQTQTVTITRPTHITLTAPVVTQSQTSGTTSHVPRGPAVVANLATPRSAVASPIRAPGLATTPPTQQTGFVTAVRQGTPSRTPSPAGTAIPTAWLSTSGAMQIQTGTVKTVGGNATVLSPTMQRVPVSGTPVRGQQVVARAQISQGTRPVMHGLAATQIFKPTSGIQSVTIAQVLPNRTQTLVYSTGSTQQFSGNPRLALTGITTNQRPVTLARSNQVMATRLAVPVSVSQGSARISVTSATGTIYTSGARITTAQTPVQNTVVGTNIRAAVPLNQPTRLTVTSPGTLLTTAQPRFTIANQSGPGSTVVIGTQAGRITGSTVSLHPVVVANTSQTARTIQTQGPKVITQQAQSANLQHQVPTVAKITAQQSTVVPVAVTVQGTPCSVATRTIIASPIVSQRPVTVPTPIVKVIMQNQRAAIDTETPTTVQNATNVFIHTTPVVRRTSPGPTSTTEVQRTPATTSTTYTVPSGTTYYYDTSSGYTVAGGNIVQRPFTPSTGSFASVPPNTPVQIRATSIPAQVHGIMSGQPIQFNPVMVVEQKRTQQFVENTQIIQQSPTSEHVNPLPSIGKVTSSPRPSILRKRDNEGSPLKAAKNLAPVLANLSAPVSPPSRPESRGNGNQSSGGSTTISATSSPGLDDVGDNSQPLPSASIANTFAAIAVKLEQDDDRPPQEMSPRKKPRKQQLTGNDLHEPKFNLDDMQFISESKIKREEPEKYVSTPVREEPPPPRNEVTVKKPAPQLLQSYRQTWKSTHNHYLRYTDVKPKDERRPSIIDLANQSHVTQKINGWKVYHLSTQMEDLVDFESQVYDTLSSMLKLMETKESTGHEKEFNHIYELIKGNMQRSKIINENMSEAKNSVMKIFDHKEHVADIINRCASKRNFKKRDKF